MKCPACTETLAENATLCDCGWRRPKATPQQERKERQGQLVELARRAYEESAPRVADLSEQQWFNVCRYFPSIAEHCTRPRPVVSPDHPLWKTSRMGLFMRIRTAAIALREPGEEG
jgi:hypothetical protein